VCGLVVRFGSVWTGVRAQHSTARNGTAQHSAERHSTVQHSTAQHSTGQRSAIAAQRSTHLVEVAVGFCQRVGFRSDVPTGGWLDGWLVGWLGKVCGWVVG